MLNNQCNGNEEKESDTLLPARLKNLNYSITGMLNPISTIRPQRLGKALTQWLSSIMAKYSRERFTTILLFCNVTNPA